MIVAPTTTAVGPAYVSFVSNPWARIILASRTLLNNKCSFFTNRIEFDSMWWKHTWYEFGTYRENTYLARISMFFFGRNNT